MHNNHFGTTKGVVALDKGQTCYTQCLSRLSSPGIDGFKNNLA